MKLNRWTILAVVLVMSTGLGLLFRPFGDGASGLVVVEEQGLSLECPEALIVTSGDFYEFECHIVNDSSYQEDIIVLGGAGSYREGALDDDKIEELGLRPSRVRQISPSMYLLEETRHALRPSSFTVTANVRSVEAEPGELYRASLITFDELLARSDVSRMILLRTETQMNLEVKYHLLFYIGLGLFALQIAALAFGPVVYLAVLRLRRLNGVRAVRRGYRIIELLYFSYIAQILLIAVFHITDTIESVDQAEVYPHPTSEFVATLPALLLFLWLIVFARWRFFLRMVPSDLRQTVQTNAEEGNAQVGARVIPFVAVAMAGWLGGLLVAMTYLLWLS